GNQDEDGAGGRFLEALEERIGRVGVEILGGMDKRDAQGAAMRADVQKARELAHLLDEDVEARLLRAPGRGLAPLLLFHRRRRLGDRLGFEAAEVRMVTSEIPAAAVAAAAGTLRRLGVLAEQKLGDALGQRELADAARTVQQQGVRQ